MRTWLFREATVPVLVHGCFGFLVIFVLSPFQFTFPRSSYKRDDCFCGSYIDLKMRYRRANKLPRLPSDQFPFRCLFDLGPS